ncbi:dihydrofolate reductase-like domain-containing protein [Fomes fomentarius]|nr:dihydrofolate reductase-like domain-containing protein [Fomes fomentarius]
MANQHLPEPPKLLLELYGLPPTSTHDSGTHPSVFYAHCDPSALPTPASSATHRPFVTLTFAQSLDAKIAGAAGKQLILSGKESMVMTHWMRTFHDAILVGIGTALNDDPQLNTRHLPPLPPDYPHSYRLPRPVILDTRLRLPPGCKLLQNYQAGRGRRPWVVCATPQALTQGTRTTAQDAELAGFARRADALQNAGARIVEVDADDATGRALAHGRGWRESDPRVPFRGKWPSPPSESSERPGEALEKANSVDALVVTVAPTVVGEAGVGYGPGLLGETLPTFEHVRTEVFGPDAVMALRVV